MKKLIPIIIFLLLIINVSAITEDERVDIKDKLIASARNPDAFENFLKDLNEKGIDLSEEQYIKDTIILRATLFGVNLKRYNNIQGLFKDEKKEQLNIEQEIYPTMDFEQKPGFSLQLGKYTNILIYVIILIVIIILAFFFTKYKSKFKSKKKASPQQTTIKQKIEQARKKGYSDEQILTQFLKHGHKEEDIKKLM